MDEDIFVQNVQYYCKLRGTTPTVACSESGVGKDLMSKFKKKGNVPSVEKVQLLAAYLGVTTSELLGESTEQSPSIHNPQHDQLVTLFDQLNEEGQEKAITYVQDLCDTGRYQKNNQLKMGIKKDA